MATTIGSRSLPPPPAPPVHLIHFLLTLGLLLAGAAPGWRPAGAQVIRLREPLLRERLQNIFAPSDNNGQRPFTGAGPIPVTLPPAVPLPLANAIAAESRTAMAAGQHQPTPSAKPGNIIVHLGADQEIERLEYMLKDGRLATVYQRHRDEPARIQSSPNEKRQNPQQYNEVRFDTMAQPPAAIKQLVLPPFRGEAIHLHEPTQVKSEDGKTESQVTTVVDLDDDDDGDGNGHDQDGHSSRDLSALLLGPKLPVPGGGHPLHIPGGGYPPPIEPLLAAKKVGKMAKAKKLMKKLKPALVLAKLKKLPKMIATKLAAKSAVGAVFLDGAAGASVPLVQHHGNRFTWSTLDDRHAPGSGAVGVVSNQHIPILAQPPSPSTLVGAIVSPPGGSSNVIRVEPSSSSAPAGDFFGAPLSHR